MGSILGSFQRGLQIVYQLLIDFSPCPGNSQWHRQSQKDFLCASFPPFQTNTEIKISNKNAEWSWRPWGYNLPSSFSFELASNYLLHLTLITRHSSKLLTSIINSLVPSMKPMWGEYDHYCVSQRKRLRHRGQVICSRWYSRELWGGGWHVTHTLPLHPRLCSCDIQVYRTGYFGSWFLLINKPGGAGTTF